MLWGYFHTYLASRDVNASPPRGLAVHVWSFRLASSPPARVDGSIHASEPTVADDPEKACGGLQRTAPNSE